MRRGIALDTTGWIILGIITALIVIGLVFVLRGPALELLQDVLDTLRFS